MFPLRYLSSVKNKVEASYHSLQNILKSRTKIYLCSKTQLPVCIRGPLRHKIRLSIEMWGVTSPLGAPSRHKYQGRRSIDLNVSNKRTNCGLPKKVIIKHNGYQDKRLRLSLIPLLTSSTLFLPLPSSSSTGDRTELQDNNKVEIVPSVKFLV